MGRRGDDLENHLDRTSYFLLILFRWPFGRKRQQAGSRSCCRTRRMESKSSYNSPPRSSRTEEVACWRWSSLPWRLRRWEASHWRLMVSASPRMGDTMWVPQRSCLPEHSPLNKGVLEVRCSHHRRLVEHIGSGSTRSAKRLSPRIAWTAVAAPSERSRVFGFADPFASMARRGCRASCSKLDTRWLVPLVIFMISSNIFSCWSKRLSMCSHSIWKRSAISISPDQD